MKPISAERFERAVAHVVTEALQSPNWQGDLQFPVPEPPSITWVADEKSPSVPTTLDLFRFHWYKNVGAARLDWSLHGPKGKLKGGVPDEVFYKYGFIEAISMLVKEIVGQAAYKGWIKDDLTSNQYHYQKKQKAIAEAYGGSYEMYQPKLYKPPGNSDYSDSGYKLSKVIPGMLFKVPETSCPHNAPLYNFCQLNPAADELNFMSLVIHLNDVHKWPRSSEDKPPFVGWDMSINIADWSEEYALKHNLDMNFRTPEEMEAIKPKKTPSPDQLEGKYDPQYLVGKVAKVAIDPGVPDGVVYFIDEDPSTEMKSMKELVKEWGSKYDEFLNSKWKDIVGEPGSGEGS